MQDTGRLSSSTDRRALLASISDASSTTSSLRTASISTETDGGDLTPRAGSPTNPFLSDDYSSTSSLNLPGASVSQTSLPRYQKYVSRNDKSTYKGFPSEEAYMDALKEWAEEKKYIQPSEEATMLQGFYGGKTMDEYVGERKKKEVKDNGDKDVKEGSGLGRFLRRKSSKKPEGT